MNNRILGQLAYDMNVYPRDFKKFCNIVTNMRKENKFTSKWMDWSASGFIMSTGSNVVASVDEKLQGIIEEYIKTQQYGYWCFDTPSIYILNDMLEKLGDYKVAGQELCLTHETSIGSIDVPLDLYLERFTDFSPLYGNSEFHNCVCDSRQEDDKFGYCMKDKNGQIVGACGVSSDSENCWQIGVDVKAGMRGRGIGKALVLAATQECEKLGKFPIYFVCWANIASLNLAYSCGYCPAFSLLTIRK